MIIFGAPPAASEPSLIDWIVAAGVGAIAVEVIRALFQRRKMGADAAKVITDAATVLLGPLQARVKDLERVATETKTELDDCREQLFATKQELHDTQEELHATKVELIEARAELAAFRQDMRGD